MPDDLRLENWITFCHLLSFRRMNQSFSSPKVPHSRQPESLLMKCVWLKPSMLALLHSHCLQEDRQERIFPFKKPLKWKFINFLWLKIWRQSFFDQFTTLIAERKFLHSLETELNPDKYDYSKIVIMESEIVHYLIDNVEKSIRLWCK